MRSNAGSTCTEIMNSIETEKKEEANQQLALIRKLRDYIN